MLRFQGLADHRRARTFTADCEAFLTGRLADRLEEDGRDVPPWAWMNLVAHGTGDDLRADQAIHGTPDFPTDRWHEVRSLLAVEVLGVAGADSSLAELQHEVLVPLELDLAARTEVGSWRPKQLVLAVEHALDDCRRLRRRARLRELAAPGDPSVRSSGTDGAVGSSTGLRSMPNVTFAGSNPRRSGVEQRARRPREEGERC